MVLRRLVMGVVVTLVGLALFGAPAPASAAPAAPYLTAPAEGERLASFSPTLTWSNPGGATRYQVQVTPFNNDGPGLDYIFGSIGNSLTLPPPPRWYGLLPDMTYTWRVRVSDAAGDIGGDDPSWGPWAAGHFRTPLATVGTITPLTPLDGETVAVTTPSLQWENTQAAVFYYEVQVSSDREFGAGPRGALAPVADSFVHGGNTHPLNSFQVTAALGLTAGRDYYWRVRPRVQGDGAPTDWTPTARFRVDPTATAPVRVRPVQFGLVADSAGCGVVDPATMFPTNPTFTAITYSYGYQGGGRVVHRWLAGDREADHAAFDLPADRDCWDARFRLGSDLPARPGDYTLQVWQAGRLVQSGTFTVAAAPALSVGPVTLGSASAPGACGVAGIGASFPAGTRFLYFRWNTVGAGAYAIVATRDGIEEVPLTVYDAAGPVGCSGGVLATPKAGAWRLQILIGTRVVQTVQFTVF